MVWTLIVFQENDAVYGGQSHMFLIKGQSLLAYLAFKLFLVNLFVCIVVYIFEYVFFFMNIEIKLLIDDFI